MSVKKKTFNLDETMIERVRRLYGLKTETEAIHRALEKVLLEAQVENTLRDFLKEGRFNAKKI